MKIKKKLEQEFILLGMHIKKLREERNISLKDLSQKTDIRWQYLQKIENGKAYGVLLERHLLKIANALSLDFVEIFKYD